MAENENKTEEACIACALKDKCLQTAEDCCTRRQRWKALLLGYILPFVVLAGSIVVMSIIGLDELILGGIALGVVAVYYFVLWLCKPKI